MAIERPVKPPLQPVMTGNGTVALDGNGNPVMSPDYSTQPAPVVQQPAPAPQVVQSAAPAQSLRPQMRPEDMPIDVMQTAPAMPVDPATPALPSAMPVDPATADITTEDVMGEEEDTGFGDNAGLAALMAAGVLTEGMRRRLSRTGTTGDPAVDEQVKQARAADAAGKPATPQTAQGKRRANANAARAGRTGGINDIDGSETAKANAAVPDGADADTGRTNPAPVVPVEPEAPNGPATGDPATDAISTEDVMPPSDDGNTRMTVIDGAPPGMPADHPHDIFTQTNSADKTLQAYVRGGDGSWYALDPVRATPQALRDQRPMIIDALRSVRGALR